MGWKEDMWVKIQKAENIVEIEKIKAEIMLHYTNNLDNIENVLEKISDDTKEMAEKMNFQN